MVFISHSSADDAFVASLRQALESLGLAVWVDSRNLPAGAKPEAEIDTAIGSASSFVVVLSAQTVNAPEVRRQIQKAVAVEATKKDSYRVVPLLLPGITPSALGMWFDPVPLAVTVEAGVGGLAAAMPALLAALGEQLPTDPEAYTELVPKPVEELILELTDPAFETIDGERLPRAIATLVYQPAAVGAREVRSRRFSFTAPIGPLEAADLRWYLETYYIWPDELAKKRAAEIAKRMEAWGQSLYRAALDGELQHEARAAWRAAGQASSRSGAAELRFSILVDPELPVGATEQANATAREAATELLGLPWELLHDGRSWLFQGRQAVRVRRRLPNRHSQPARPPQLPIRILFLSPRPEQDRSGHPISYFDHRLMAQPLVEAIESLGDLARLTILTPPTYGALEIELKAASDRGEPYDVIHFDGHGVYDRRIGLGALCFEDASDEAKLEGRRMDLVYAAKLAGLVCDHRIPLVFLEACQTSVAEANPTASVAGRLLEEGVSSVVAMSHCVLIETARRFVKAFYAELAQGARVGRAMLAGQQALFADSLRGTVLGAGELRLADWFVPVLFQEELDPQLVTKLPPREVQKFEARRRQLSVGALRDKQPPHAFQGRSRELLALERLLHREPWAVVRGIGGQGKTTLAVELALWLVRTGRFQRAAFVSLEHHRDARAVLDTLGHQLLPAGDKYSVATFTDLAKAFQPVESALTGRATIVVLDNCESILPERSGEVLVEGDAAGEVFSLCKSLLDANRRTRLVFTSREPLPAPFAVPRGDRELGALDRKDAIQLVSEVMRQNGWTPSRSEKGSTPREVEDLVESVHCHARALVLLAREVAKRGVKATTEDLRALMTDLEGKHPGDRENSLLASVALSLRRLSPASRQRIRPLAVCHGGVHIRVLKALTGLDAKATHQLSLELIEVGLGEDMGNGHLRLDPGLAPALFGELGDDEVEGPRVSWAEAMSFLAIDLYEERLKDARVAAFLTLLEVPNLLALLDWIVDHLPPERVLWIANNVEGLVADLCQPRLLARATAVREQASQRLGAWSHIHFVSELANIQHLLNIGEFTMATPAAEALLQATLAAGESAYSGAAYDVAFAHFTLGRVLEGRGISEAALPLLVEAQRRFQALVDSGDENAKRMASVAMSDIGDCLRKLGRLDEAAEAYEEAIRLDQAANRLRDLAVQKANLGHLRLLQNRNAEALALFHEVCGAFEEIREPLQVASSWQSIAMAHAQSGDYQTGEQAYRQALAIWVRENNSAGQASCLAAMGNLFSEMGRFEEATTLLRQAAERYVERENPSGEGRTRNHLAHTLIQLQQYEEARCELHKAIACDEPFGNAAESWSHWGLLERLEVATDHGEAAQVARLHAIDAYLAYRRAGGFSESYQDQLFTFVKEAISAGTEPAARDELSSHVEPGDPPTFITLVQALQAVLVGNRNSALADDPNLDYKNAAELQLLLEHLAQPQPTP